MKLLICLECSDIFNLTMREKHCICKKSSGKYIDNLNTEIKGNCKCIGFSNESFKKAYMMQKIEDKAQEGKPSCCKGTEFTAFFIPDNATSVKRIE